ncbi:MAG: IS1182 family transposase [Planctomycetota bacterium]|nr:IS1182 family transposase [Planctomycetota bacterium]MDA0921515.1 IS1182 family transposase [Planctomycetota bacterium]MDA1160203.1 IS1182 family transposase [Planctomycetota bacterium]
MATTDYWADARLRREQMTLFSPTLDSVIGDDDPVRLFDEVLAGSDWSLWEAEYHGCVGQPAIHPRHLAAAILYGLYRRVRSSRQLEEATYYRLDFIWLLHGRRIDHTTLAKFRTRFRKPLKELFRRVGRMAMTLGLVRLCEVAFDGTRVKANNSRHATRTAKTLEEKLAALDELFEQMMAEQDADDARQQTLTSRDDSPTRLPASLANLERRRQKVRDALVQAQAADEARRKLGRTPEKNPAQVPTTDPESRVMPNKDGGYAPNYTPTATTDGHRGFIVDCDVTSDVNEGSLAAPSVDQIEEAFGEKPRTFLTDGGNNSGAVMHQMEQRGVEFLAPVESCIPQPGNPALRDDPTQPVADSQKSQLPRNRQGQLAKSCFVYVAKQDTYYCPQGNAMPHAKSKRDRRGHAPVTRRIYRCSSCDGCPWAADCISATTKHGRTITRDEYEEVRERTVVRMSQESSQTLFRRRSWMAETPFGTLKSVTGVRQFLLRGLEKVQTEWTWATTAFNLGKLVRELARLRAEFALLAETNLAE